LDGFDGYYAVAAAQAMMEPYNPDAHGGVSCGVGQCCDVQACGMPCSECGRTVKSACPAKTCPAIGQCDGGQQGPDCKCDQLGGCNCGRGTLASGTNGTAGLGCWRCAVAKFLRQSPYSGQSKSSCSDVDESDLLDDREYKLVVADACPYGGNAKWCPRRDGDLNQCGFHNHIDIGTPPSGIGYNTNYIIFRSAPCSDALIEHIKATIATHGDKTCPYLPEAAHSM
jgi:hypothetical protein